MKALQIVGIISLLLYALVAYVWWEIDKALECR